MPNWTNYSKADDGTVTFTGEDGATTPPLTSGDPTVQRVMASIDASQPPPPAPPPANDTTANPSIMWGAPPQAAPAGPPPPPAPAGPPPPPPQPIPEAQPGQLASTNVSQGAPPAPAPNMSAAPPGWSQLTPAEQKAVGPGPTAVRPASRIMLADGRVIETGAGRPGDDGPPPMLARPPEPVVRRGPGGPRQPSAWDKMRSGVEEKYGVRKGDSDAMSALQEQTQGDIARVQDDAYWGRKASDQLQHVRDQQLQGEADHAFEQVKQRTAEYMAEPGIDPDHYWAEAGTGARITAAIGTALMGFGGGSAGVQTALGHINQAINRDIDSQKENLAKKKSAIGEARTLYEANLQRMGDARAAYALTRAQGIQDAQDQIGSLIANAKTAEIRLQGLQAQHALGEQKKAEIQAANDAEARARAAAAQAQAAAVRAAEDRTLKIAKEKAEIGKTVAETGKLVSESGGGEAAAGASPDMAAIGRLPKEERAGAIKELGTKQKVAQATKDIADLFQSASGSKYGALDPTGVSSASKNVKEVGTQITGLVSTLHKGPMSEGDYAREIAPNLPSASDSDEDTQRKVARLQQFVRRNADPTPVLDAYGIGRPPPAPKERK